MALNILTDTWIDVKKLQRSHPNEFMAPSESILVSLSVGDLVKIGNNYERFWVKVVKITTDYVLGKIDNHLTFNNKYDYNDIILFEKNNIYEIYDTDVENYLDYDFLLKKKNIN